MTEPKVNAAKSALPKWLGLRSDRKLPVHVCCCGGYPVDMALVDKKRSSSDLHDFRLPASSLFNSSAKSHNRRPGNSTFSTAGSENGTRTYEQNYDPSFPSTSKRPRTYRTYPIMPPPPPAPYMELETATSRYASVSIEVLTCSFTHSLSSLSHVTPNKLSGSIVFLSNRPIKRSIFIYRSYAPCHTWI